MKKFLSILSVLILIFSLAGCNSTGTKLSLECDHFDDFLVKIDYSDKYKVNDEYVEITVDKVKGAKLPECNVAVYQNETLLVQVLFYQKNNLRDLYNERLEALFKYADPNAEKSPAAQNIVWEITEDKTTANNPYIIAKCTTDFKKEGSSIAVNYEYLAMISEEDGLSVRFLCEEAVNEKLLKDIIKNVKFSVVKK